MTDCIADDSSACDCDACRAAEDRFWEEQGETRDRCVLGAECCCPHPFHGPDECHTAEMAEAYMAPEQVQQPLSGRQRTRALWRKRGRR